MKIGRMKHTLSAILLIIFGLNVPVQSQNSTQYADQLSKHFEEYAIQELDVDASFVQLKNIHQFQEFQMQSPDGKTWTFDLFPSNVLSEDFVYTKLENGKKIHQTEIAVFPYRGYVKGDPHSKVTLTVADGFIQGTVSTQGLDYSFQNLDTYIKSAPSNEILLYENEKIIEGEDKTCEIFNAEKIDELVQNENKSNLACLGLQLAFANDFSMYQSYGNGVLAHNIAIMNDAQGNYTSDFNDEIEFTLEQIFVAVTADDDPWTSSTDLETFLIDFSGWGNTGGFDVIYDLATIWTERNFDGPPVGGAWTNGLCSNMRYNAIQDYTANANLMRVVLAHEMGHNFNANHDAGGSGFIMAPAVNNTNTWSAASITSINNKISSVSCLGGCQGFFTAPVAEFSHDLTSTCSPATVNFFDESNGDIVSWIWLFPGGEPEYSTEQNPTVFYAVDGTYDVTLAVATDGGSDELVSFGEIVLSQSQDVDFDVSISGNIASFTNTSFPLTGDFLWDFGDGNTSTSLNPVHQYIQDGFYEVTLTHSGCGSIEASEFIEIATAPIADFFTNFTFDCQPFTVEFLNNSSSNATSYVWEFEGGTPATSTDFDPIVVYNEPGTFDVSLTVSNDNGSDQFEIFDYITVDPLPQAGFDFDVDMLTVSFTDASEDANSVLWDFGDGSSASMFNPEHTYATGGSYMVTQIVSNNCGDISLTQEVVVNSGPAAAINYDINSGCTDLAIMFDGTASSSATTYAWNFPGGIPVSSDQVSPTVEYVNPGIFDVSLIVSDGTTSDTLEMEDLVIVNTVPDAASITSVDTMTLFGVAMADASMNTTYTWDFGDGNIGAGDTVLHSYAEENMYQVILTAENECGIEMDTTALNLYTVPTAAFSNSTASGCAPFTVNFTDNSTNAITEWAWSFPGGNPSSSTDQNPSVEYIDAGTYAVSLMVTNPSGADAISIDNLIVIDDVPLVDFFAVNNLTTVSFTNQTVNGTSYMWDFGDGNSSDEESPVHTYGAEGMYTVSLTATNACGTASQTQEIEVNQLPTAGFVANVEEGCIPFEVTFMDASSSNVTSWEWSFEGGTPANSTEASPVVSYTAVGEYDVQLIVDSPAGKDTLNMQELIFADDVPAAFFELVASSEFVYQFTNGSVNATSFLWDFGDGITSIEQNPMHTYAEPGDYTVRLTATNNCGSTTWEELITIVESSVLEIESIQELWIQPNPNRGSFHLFIQASASETIEIQILNLLGQSMFSQSRTIQSGENRLYFEVEDLTNGTYLLNLQADGKRAIKKFIINK